MANESRWTQIIHEAAEVALITRIRLGIHGDRGLRHNLFQHPDSTAGADGQGDGIAGPCVDIEAVEPGVRIALFSLVIAADELQNGAEGVVLNGVNDHPVQREIASHQQRRHEVVTEGTGRFVTLQPRHDVVGLGLVDPDRDLATAAGVPEQHDRCAAGCIEGDAGNAHFHHGGAAALSDYGQRETAGETAMFTGLVQAVGWIQRRGAGVVVEGCAPFGPLCLGDSVAVDGVCLTVADRVGDGFRADVSEETLSRTTLGRKAERGAAVNLEPALRLSDRLGGHLVSGHIDAVGHVQAIEELPQSWMLTLRWGDPRFGRYVCEKASVAVDGISLTVADCSADGSEFRLAVIPHTWSVTSLRERAVGDKVNLEADQLARYAERLLMAGAESDQASGDISSDWLSEHGWS